MLVFLQILQSMAATIGVSYFRLAFLNGFLELLVFRVNVIDSS